MLDSTDNSISGIQADVHKAIAAIETIILGKTNQIKLAVCCMIARGHCLIEDLPGVGKTTLSQSIARAFGLGFNRIQFTSDLLPADILGVSIFDPEQQAFRFRAAEYMPGDQEADNVRRELGQQEGQTHAPVEFRKWCRGDQAKQQDGQSEVEDEAVYGSRCLEIEQARPPEDIARRNDGKHR